MSTATKQPSRPYSSARVLSWLAVGSLGLTMTFGLAAMFAPFTHEVAAASGNGSSAAGGNLPALIAGAKSLAYLASYTTFMLWTYWAYRNLRAIGAKRVEYSPGWAVGSWFVPFLNLYRPLEVISELWRGSQIAVDAVVAKNVRRRYALPRMLLTWWLLFLGGNVMSWLSFFAMGNRLSGGVLFQELQSVLHLAAAALAIRIILTIQRGQDERAQEIFLADPIAV